MNTTTFSVRVGRSTKSRLEKLAKNTGRSRSFLASEAISAYLDTNEWQVSGIARALKRPHLNNTDRFLFVWLYHGFRSFILTSDARYWQTRPSRPRRWRCARR